MDRLLFLGLNISSLGMPCTKAPGVLANYHECRAQIGGRYNGSNTLFFGQGCGSPSWADLKAGTLGKKQRDGLKICVGAGAWKIRGELLALH